MCLARTGYAFYKARKRPCCRGWPKIQHSAAEHRGLTTNKISDIEQLAYNNKAFIIVLQATHCKTAGKVVITNFSLVGSFLSRKHGFAAFVHERLEWPLVDHSPEQSETGWLCVDVAGYKITSIYKPPRSRFTPTAIQNFARVCYLRLCSASQVAVARTMRHAGTKSARPFIASSSKPGPKLWEGIWGQCPPFLRLKMFYDQKNLYSTYNQKKNPSPLQTYFATSNLKTWLQTCSEPQRGLTPIEPLRSYYLISKRRSRSNVEKLSIQSTSRTLATRRGESSINLLASLDVPLVCTPSQQTPLPLNSWITRRTKLGSANLPGSSTRSFPICGRSQPRGQIVSLALWGQRSLLPP